MGNDYQSLDKVIIALGPRLPHMLKLYCMQCSRNHFPGAVYAGSGRKDLYEDNIEVDYRR